MSRFEVALLFTVDGPPHPLRDALAAVREVEVEAPSSEAAEHFVDQIRLALQAVTFALERDGR